MEIISVKYLLYVLLFLVTFQLLNTKYRSYWVLGFSLFFYGSISQFLLLALLISIGFNYWITYTKFKFKNSIAIIFNTLLLFSFKWSPSNFTLPIGISFFTFQALSFVFDQSNTKPVTIIQFANYLSFFPQLIAGPIEKYDHLAPQLTLLKPIQRTHFFPGISLALKGLVFKFVIANRCGIIVKSFYDEISYFDGWMLLLANTLFTFQILLDFSGYCLLARGIAKIMGVELSKNFFSPYLSSSLSDFWKRWHTTLHIWFKNYVFKPLIIKYSFWKVAGIIFLISSLWHGLKINFLIWGMTCFVLLLMDKYLIQKFICSKKITWFITFCCVSLSWIPFRISDFNALFNLSWNLNDFLLFVKDHHYVIFNDFMNNISSTCEYAGKNLGITFLDFYIMTLSLITFCVCSIIFKSKIKHNLYTSFIFFLLLCFLGFDNSTPFIYFQF